MGDTFRAPAEFEPQSAVLLPWTPLDFPLARMRESGAGVKALTAQIAALLTRRVQVHLNCTDPALVDEARAALTSAGADLDRVTIVTFPDEIGLYPRDNGADILIGPDGSRRWVDLRWSGYGLHEVGHPFTVEGAALAGRHAGLLGVANKVETWLVSEGGDREVDGAGLLMAIAATELDRNPGRTLAEIETELRRLYQVSTVIWLPEGTYDDDCAQSGPLTTIDGVPVLRSGSARGHLDEVARFVAVGTVLLAEVTDEEAHHSDIHARNKERIDAAYAALLAATDAEGHPLTIVRIPMPETMVFEVTSDDPLRHEWEAWLATTDAPGRTLLDGTPVPDGDLLMAPAASYCNFLITNGLVIGQRYWEPGLPDVISAKDDAAAAVLRDLFPDREVVMVPSLPLNFYGGGVHCHTRNVPA